MAPPPDPKTYLATNLLSDQQTVTYRTLSRALKVHVNAAKCMLYEFHTNENKKKPNSIHATYLLSGRKKHIELAGDAGISKPFANGNGNTNGDDGDPSVRNNDVSMPSSPPMLPISLAPGATQDTETISERYHTNVKTITLCREEMLKEVKEQYETITSIHIYSLSPSRIIDLQSLTDASRAIFTDYHAKQDPQIHNKDYGIIQNSNVRRRKGKRPLNVDAPVSVTAAKNAAKASEAKAASRPFSTTKPEAQKEVKEDPSRPSSQDSTSTSATATATANQDQPKSKATLKKESSSLFKAFAKQNQSGKFKPGLKREDTDASVTSGAGSDIKMVDDEEEGESEDEAVFLDTGTTNKGKKRAVDVTREKEERRAKLRKMMDDDEEEVREVPSVEEAAGVDSQNDEPIAAKGGSGDPDDAPDNEAEEDADADGVAWSDSDSETKKIEAQTNAKTEPEGPRRRRRKRKVMKKKTTKDEDGFLVTKEEEAWESFSEDEPEPVAVKKAAAAALKGSQQKSSAPKGTAAGVGGEKKKKKDIMSFFGKK